MTETTMTVAVADKVVERVRQAIPGASAIQVYPASKPFAVIGFDIEAITHTFRLSRQNGIWTCREWILDGAPQRYDHKKSSPRFEALIQDLLGGSLQPRIELVELRCPADTRRLFGKLLIQHPMPREARQVTLEVSCPQCKRNTNMVTMHYYGMDGKLVKTDTIEPWILREPSAWYDNGTPARDSRPAASTREAAPGPAQDQAVAHQERR